jgi:transposase
MKKAKSLKSLPLLNDRAAAIDVGSETLHVSIAGDAPQVFGTMTSELHRLREYLQRQSVRTVAMEATGVYWLCTYGVLESAGLEVVVVNGRHVRNVPGRKTDMADSQWLATLHAHGLLRSGFVPPANIRRLQDYLRLREDHISMASSHVQHMQKALERMNVKLHDVLSDLTGDSGLAVMRAILGGERDPQTLLQLCDKRIRKRKAEAVCEALRGTWKDEHLFALRQALAAWEFYQGQIAECDQAIEQVLREVTGWDRSDEAPTATTRKRPSPNAPQIQQLHDLLMKLCGGHDATSIPAITDYSLLRLVGEVGTDLSLWPTEKHFTSWTGLAPGSHQSGKRRGRVRRRRNRVGQIFCMIAQSLARSVDKALGGFYRRLRARRGGLIATQALARKLAALFWQLMVHGAAYAEEGLRKYEERVLKTEQYALRKLAQKHGFALQPNAAPSSP